MRRRREFQLIYGVLALVALVTWEFASRTHTARLMVSSPTAVVSYTLNNGRDLLRATWTTGAEAFLGLLLASVASFGLITLTFFAPRILRPLLPLMITSQVVPLIVLAPFFVITLGIGMSSKVAMAAVLCFFPIFVGLAQGYRLISQDIHDLLDVYDTPRRLRVAKAYLPLAMPSGIAGLKVSATLSVIGAIVAEFTGSEVGLGRNLFLSTIRLQPDLMVASVFGSVVLGASMYWGVHLIERRFGAWYLPRQEE